jgi:hypothetical protein
LKGFNDFYDFYVFYDFYGLNDLPLTVYRLLLTTACGMLQSNIRIWFFPCQMGLDVLNKPTAGKSDNLPILWAGK